MSWERDLIVVFNDAQHAQTLSPMMSPESAAKLLIHSYEGVMFGKVFTQCIERNNLTLRTLIKPLARRTICFSRSVELHKKVIGAFNCSGVIMAWTARPRIR